MAPETQGATVPLGFGRALASVGDHIAHFYRGREELFSVLGPYVAEGIRRGDYCVVICSAETADNLRTWMGSDGIDARAAEREGRLVLDPGEATAAGMRTLFERVEANALGAGHKFVRLAGDGGWALAGNVSPVEMLRWEALYDEVSAGWEMLALCQFDLTSFGGDVVMDALRAHPMCVMGEVVIQNPLHVSPQALLQELSERS